MLLQALAEYAKREGLLANADYEPSRVDWVLEIDASGRLLAAIESGDTREVPRRSQRSGTKLTPHLFVDNVLYVLGVDDAGARAVVAFGERLAVQRETVLSKCTTDKSNGSETFAFRLANDIALVHEREAVRERWRELRVAAVSGETERPSSKKSSTSESKDHLARCLVTGTIGPVARIHPVIKRVPAGNAQTAIVTYNSDAFESFGMLQGENAPLSRAAAEAYVTGLNHLLSEDPTTGRPHRGGVKVGNSSVMLIWTREPAPAVSSILDLLSPPHRAEAGAVVAAPWTGLEPEDLDTTPFYGLAIGANQARVVVRDWFTATLGEAKRAVRKWFDGLALSGHDPQHPMAIWQLLSALKPPGRNAELPPALEARLVGAALREQRLPPELIRLALARLRVPERSEAGGKGKGPSASTLLRQRIAIIKATLIRTYSKEISMALDEHNTDPAYLLGRLFAILEKQQEAALGTVNASIRDRYFGAASRTPSVVFPRLLTLNAHHAREDKAKWLERPKGLVMLALPAKRMPATLSLEDQGLFAVGYYHQRQSFFTKHENVTDEAA